MLVYCGVLLVYVHKCLTLYGLFWDGSFLSNPNVLVYTKFICKNNQKSTSSLCKVNK